MKGVTVLLFALPLLLVPEPIGFSDGNADFAETRGELRLAIVGLTSNDGVVSVGLYDTEEDYSAISNSFRKAKLPIVDRRCQWVVQDLPYGDYAVMLYHDENGNHELDTNVLRLPSEPYGFSNNARPRLSLPPYEKTKFMVQAKTTALEIQMQ